MTHEPVEQLVEVNVAAFTFDAHLEQYLLDGIVFHLAWIRQAYGWRQGLVEGDELLFFERPALGGRAGKLRPRLFERLKFVLEGFQRILVVKIVLVELLNDDQNEEIEHDVGDEHDEDDVVHPRER